MSFKRNFRWNILATAISYVSAVPFFYFMAQNITLAEFGLFTLLFSLFGLSSIFDAGISRTVVLYTSSSSGEKARTEYLVVSMLIAALFSTCFVVVATAFVEPIVSLTNLSDTKLIQSESSLIVTFFIIFVVVNIGVLEGYLEGIEQFVILAKVKSFIQVLMMTLPLIYMSYTYYDVLVCFKIMLLIKLLHYIFMIFVVFKYSQFRHVSFLRIVIYTKRILSYGSWLSLSNIISQSMTVFDKFLVTAIVGLDSSVFFNSAAEIIKRCLIIPQIYIRTIFPRIVKGNAGSYFISMLGITISIYLVLSFTSDYIVYYWLGESFMPAVNIVTILSFGFVFNSLAQVPYAKLQANGFSKITFYIHFLEVFPFYVLLYVLVTELGVIGGAYAWTIRCIIDFLLLSLANKKFGL